MEGPMLQVLLEERFKLTLHRETRQLPVYDLAVPKGGAKLQTSKEGSCTPYLEDSAPRQQRLRDNPTGITAAST